jgi:hypothetical protein
MGTHTIYFPHDCHSRNDRKLVNLIMKHGMEGVGIFWCLVEMLYEEGGSMPLEYERITFDLRTNENVLRSVISDFELFVKDGDNFYSESVNSRFIKIKEKSEKAKISISHRWKNRPDTNVIRPLYERNTKKEIKEKKIKDIYTPDFELFWSAYPNKKAKGRALVAWNKINGGRPEVSLMIDKLSAQKKTVEWTKENGQYIPHPSTWLNDRRWEDDVNPKLGGGF